MKLKELLESIDGVRLIGDVEKIASIEISGLCDDSRFVKEGDLFFCRKGQNVDSHLFVLEAVKKGARAVVCEREVAVGVPQMIVADCRLEMARLSAVFYGQPSKRLKIVGITGTNGKTTTAYMLASILRRAGKAVGIIGTLGIYYGKKKIAPELTTPDPIFLQATLRDMVEEGIEYVVMEVSAHALFYRKDASIEYAAGIFTNLSQDHLDFFPDMQSYGEAKRTLFAKEKCAICILNGDDKFGRTIGERRGGEECEEVIYYGLETPCDCFAIVTEETLRGMDVVFNVMDGIFRIPISMTGLHNAYNALAAATCAYALGLSTAEIAEGLRQVRRVKGRLELVADYCGAKIFVDFAHTPDGLEKSLQALKKHVKGKLFCLFGCGGNRDRTKRPLMGEVVAKNADFSIITSDNPRYEDPMDIISSIEKGYRRVSNRYVIVPDRERAIEYALELLSTGDVLLVAGKGAEEYQEIMGIKYLFCDNDFIKKTIHRKGESSL